MFILEDDVTSQMYFTDNFIDKTIKMLACIKKDTLIKNKYKYKNFYHRYLRTNIKV